MTTGRRDSGFTLIELMITLGVTLTVLGVTTQLLVQSSRSFTNGQAAMETRNNNAAGVDMMERLIRQATTINADPDANGVFDTIRVVADWNPRDGVVTGPYETVTFSTAGGMLQMSESAGAAAVPYAAGVAQLTFAYSDHRGDPLPTATVLAKPALIGMVRISVLAPSIAGRPPVLSRTSVAIRRVK